jgi:hypothetical protein
VNAVATRGLAALWALAWAAACGRSEGPPAGPAPAQPLRGGVLAPPPRFRPPADGLLTDEQVETFIRVRRAAKGRTVAEAARALGVLPEELSWTRARIVEAMVALDEKRAREAAAEGYARAVVQLKAAQSAARNPSDARVVEEQIAALERDRASLRREQTPPPALARNIARVAGRRAELESLAP